MQLLWLQLIQARTLLQASDEDKQCYELHIDFKNMIIRIVYKYDHKNSL